HKHYVSNKWSNQVHIPNRWKPPDSLQTLEITISINNNPHVYQTLIALTNTKALTSEVYNKQYIDNLIADYYTRSQVDVLFSNLTDSTPATLNALKELATALNDDANYASTIRNQLININVIVIIINNWCV
ncbi:MAG: hypothetical protein ACKPKO_63440, partial [Candidatus Fonsibacter sp.]